MTTPIPAFSWFGGKRRVAHVVWQALGKVGCYVEPFIGGGAVFLARPGGRIGIEIINDADGALVNFWRAARAGDQSVFDEARQMSSVVDLTAKRDAIKRARPELLKMLSDTPDFYDARLAAWWLHGQCSAMGGTWAGASSLGLHYHHARGAQCAGYDWTALVTRLRGVFVFAGDWRRAVDNAASRANVTGYFLDPPYPCPKYDATYAEGNRETWHEVAAWALEAGQNRKNRIALCGYHGDFGADDWTEYRWSTGGGFGNQADGRGRRNAQRECIWFSPGCEHIDEDLFGFALDQEGDE